VSVIVALQVADDAVVDETYVAEVAVGWLDCAEGVQMESGSWKLTNIRNESEVRPAERPSVAYFEKAANATVGVDAMERRRTRQTPGCTVLQLLGAQSSID